jgi:D-alanine--poly(phosphoribitol) ligase subunit 2
MQDVPTIIDAVRAYILDEFLPGEPPESLTGDVPLITGGILDSIATLKVVLFLEERFGIVLAAHEVDRERLDTLNKIAALLESKR